MPHNERPREPLSERQDELLVRLQHIQLRPAFKYDEMIYGVDTLLENLKKAKTEVDLEKIESHIAEAEENDGALYL